MLEALKGSCALPFLYRGTVRVGHDELVDGGISDPLPVREAYRRGARTLVVVRSRAADFVKNDRLVNRFGAWTMRSKPPIARACRTTPAAYGNAVAFLRSPPADCNVIQVAPVHEAGHEPHVARPRRPRARLRPRPRVGPRGHRAVRGAPRRDGHKKIRKIRKGRGLSVSPS